MIRIGCLFWAWCLTASVVSAQEEAAPDAPMMIESDSVFSPAFSSDGKLLAAAGGSLIEIWDVQSGKRLHAFSGHKDVPRAVDFTPDGRQIVSGANDGSVKWWDVAAGQEQASLAVDEVVDALDVSPDGKTIAVALFNHAIVLIEIETKKIRTQLDGHTGRSNGVVFSPDGKQLASAGDVQDKMVRVWDTATGRQIAELSEHGTEVAGVDYSPDGKHLISVGNDGLRLWDAATLRHKQQLVEEQYLFTEGVRWSPDGKTLALTRNSDVVLLDAASGKQLRVLRGHTGPTVGLSFSPKGDLLASTGFDSTLRIWNASAAKQDDKAYAQVGSEMATLDGRGSAIDSLAFSPDGRRLVSADNMGKLVVWDVAARKPAATIKAADLAVGKIEFSTNGKALVFLGPYGTFTRWDLQQEKTANEIEMDASSPNDFEFMPRQPYVAATKGFDAVILSVRTGKVVRQLTGHTDQVRSLEWLVDGKTLATGSHDGTVRLWDTAAGKVTRTLKITPDEADDADHTIHAIDLSPDGKTLVAVGDGLVAWELDTGQETFRVDASELYAYDVLFSPDGKLIAAGDVKRWVGLWGADTGDQLAKLEGHTDSVFVLAFSPDSKLLASGGSDETVKLWDLSSLRKKPDSDPKEVAPGLSSQSTPPSAEDTNGVRTWTDKTGKFNIQGKLLTYRAGRVQLEKEDGTTIWIRLGQLSDQDRDFVLEYRKKMSASDAGRPKSSSAEAHPVLGYRLGNHPDDAVAFGGHWHKVLPGQSTWKEAQENCKSLGGYLACVTTRQELAHVTRLQPQGHLWFGAIRGDEGRWVWITGEPMTLQNWNPGEPNNAGNREFFMKTGPGGFWFDVPNDDGNVVGCICEWEK